MARQKSAASTALLALIVLIISLQLFLLVVAAEAFMTRDPQLAWTAAGVSAGLAVFAVLFYKVLPRRD